MTYEVRQKLVRAALVVGLALGVCSGSGASEAVPEVSFRDGRFEPNELLVTAGEPFKLRVSNHASDVIEFESFELHRERAVQPGQTIEINFPSRQPGSYKFFDDFHEGVAAGAIIVK